MKSILVATTALFLSFAVTEFSSAQEVREISRESRDDAVAEGVRALSEDVRKLSDDVKELVALIKLQQKNPSIEMDSGTTVEPKLAVPQFPSSGTNDISMAHAAQLRKKWLSKLNEQKLNDSEVSDLQDTLNVEFRDLSLVEAKTLAMKNYRDSRSGVDNVNDEFERKKDEQNLLKRVEEQYWDLLAAYKVFDARRKETTAMVDCWRVALTAKFVDGGKMTELVAGFYDQCQHDLHASLNGSDTHPRTRGLRQSEWSLRQTLGLQMSGAMLRPTEMPTLKSQQLEWPALQKMTLSENVFLKEKRRALEVSPSKKFADELATSELMLNHELACIYRNLQTNFASFKLNREWLEACDQEITIYHGRLKSKVGDRDLLIENIARAHQRRAQAECQHVQAVCEYNKDLAGVKYLCSQLTVGSD